MMKARWYMEILAERLRQALKHGRVIAFTLLAVAFAPLILWATRATFSLPSSLSSLATRRARQPEKAPAAASHVKREELLRPLRAVIRPGSNVYSLLVKAGLAPGDVHKLIEDFAEAADLTKCRPGETFTINQRPDGSIASIVYQKGPLEIFNAAKDRDAWRVTRERVPYTSRLEQVAGSVESSLFQAVESLGEKDSLAVALIDILAWEIDFAHESQPGDRFSLLVEKLYIEDRFIGYGPILAAEYGSTGRRVQAFSLPKDKSMDYFNEAGQSLRKTFLKSPLRFTRITSGYTSRRLHPVTGRVQPHYAIDYGAPLGTPVWAVADGVIQSVSYDEASGRKVILSHPGGYESYYLHLSRYAKGMTRGARVGQKQVLGYVGATGLATGPHLDYRLRRHGSFVNPLKENFPRAEPVSPQLLKEFTERVSWLKPCLDNMLQTRVACVK